MTTYYSEYSKVYVSVDCIIFGFDEGQLRVLIGKRQLGVVTVWRIRRCQREH